MQWIQELPVGGADASSHDTLIYTLYILVFGKSMPFLILPNISILPEFCYKAIYKY